MAFLDILFPTAISYHSNGGPIHGVNIVQTNGGATSRNAYWTDPLRKYDAMSGVQTDTQLDNLHAFFLVVGGPLYSFRWKDWKDYTLTSANGVGSLLVLSGTTMQIQKVYTPTGSGLTYTRKITRPVTGTLAFTRNGSPITPTSIDYSTGIITVTTSTGTWTVTGEFHVPVYFGTPTFQASYDDVNNNSVQLPVMEDRNG